jgi:hypothetical protein
VDSTTDQFGRKNSVQHNVLNSMAKNFKELEAKMPPESLARAKLRASEMVAQAVSDQLREPPSSRTEGDASKPVTATIWNQSHQKNQ